jgi:uncharacterized BrkB/YihY/UPF0761 family membrane protein
LISGAHHIPVANELGIRKMIRNIATLQQGLRMLSRTENDDSVQLAQAKAYYSLFFIPPAVRAVSLFHYENADDATGHDRGDTKKTSFQLR